MNSQLGAAIPQQRARPHDVRPVSPPMDLMPEPPLDSSFDGYSKLVVPLEPQDVPSQMSRTSSAIVNRLIFSVCPTERGHNGPVLEVRCSCHQGTKTGTREVLMDAKHVGSFHTGRGYDRYPSVDGSSRRSSIVIPAETGRLRVSAVPPTQQVSRSFLFLKN